MKILAWKLKKKIAENTITKIKHPETGNMMTNLSKIQGELVELSMKLTVF